MQPGEGLEEKWRAAIGSTACCDTRHRTTRLAFLEIHVQRMCTGLSGEWFFLDCCRFARIPEPIPLKPPCLGSTLRRRELLRVVNDDVSFYGCSRVGADSFVQLASGRVLS